MFRTTLLLLPLGLTLGCEVSNDGSTGNCTDNGQCDEMQACVENNCADVDCLVSSDCALHQYCQTVPANYTCADGCLSDDDCAAGEACSDSNTCEDYGCRTTELDCPVGHTCNTSTGDCIATQGLCTETCDVYDNDRCSGSGSCQVVDWGDVCNRDNDCDAGYACDMFLAEHTTCWSDSDCTVAGATCYYLQCVISNCHKDYCLPECNLNNPDCPAGFSCEDAGTGGVCWGACEWYVESGYL